MELEFKNNKGNTAELRLYKMFKDVKYGDNAPAEMVIKYYKYKDGDLDPKDRNRIRLT